LPSLGPDAFSIGAVNPMSTPRRALPLLVCLCALGCGLLERRFAGPAPGGASPALTNPLLVPQVDAEFTWNQIVDTVDDYFEIAREQPVQRIGEVLVEGRIETAPQPGATLLEPFRRDSTRGFERWQSTFQSIRRQAQVRVVPAGTGLEVHVAVYKELEDVSQPENATVGQATRRHDGSLVRYEGFRADGPATLGWISIGRDTALEQEMIAQLHARLHETAEAGGR
jgi:hypothetical protein